MTDTTLPATVEELESALRAITDPVHRARVAGLLVDAGMRQMAARVRAEAIYQATRERGAAERVAETLGTGVNAIRKAIKIHNARQEITLAELTAELNLPADAAERVARFAGAFRDPADAAKTGRLPKRWEGQGMAATFTRDEAEELVAEWHRAAAAVEAGATLPCVNEAETEADRAELASRYQ